MRFPRFSLAALFLLVLIVGVWALAVFRETAAIIEATEPWAQEDLTMTTWEHTLAGGGTITITVYQRDFETIEAYDTEVARKLLQYPPS